MNLNITQSSKILEIERLEAILIDQIVNRTLKTNEFNPMLQTIVQPELQAKIEAQKYLEEQKKEDQKKQYFKQFFDFIGDLPFWINDKKEHFEVYKQQYDKYEIPFCCLNHFIGLPYKKDDNGIMQPHPKYPYEQILHKGLLEKKYK